MAAVSVTLTDTRDNTDIKLPLQLQSISYSDINLTRCHKVLESGHYTFALHLNLNDLNDLLVSEQTASDGAEDSSTGSPDAVNKSEQANTQASAEDNQSPSSSDELAYASEGTEKGPEAVGYIFNTDKINSTAKREISSINSATGVLGPSSFVHTNGEDLSDFYSSDFDNSPLSLLGEDGSFKHFSYIYLYINDELVGSFDYDLIGDQKQDLIGKAILNPQRCTNVNQPFLMHYDALKLRLKIGLFDGQQINLYSDYLLCTCSADNNRNISRILEELSALNDSQVLDLMFMQNALEENFSQVSYDNVKEHRSYKSLISYIELISHVIDCYQKQYNIFMASGKHVLVKGYELQSFESVRSVTHKSHQWLMRNPQVLSEAPRAPYGIDLNGRKYLPSHMQGEVTKKSFDTPENRAVIGFIRTVMLQADRIFNEYTRIISEQQRLTGNIGEASEDVPQAPILALKGIQIKIYRTQLCKLKANIEALNRIYLSYAKIFGIRDAVLQNRPLKSKVFREIKPYAAVYNCITSYYFFGEFDSSKDFLLFQVSRLDKLFEYYCLYRLIGMLLENGFTAAADKPPMTYLYQSASKFINYDEQVANTYYFQRGKHRITLYYQPVISSFTFENGIRAFRTTATTPYACYTPDFILKVSSTDKIQWDDDYLIFDSKFSNASNVERYYLEDLKNKYADETAIAVLKKRNAQLVLSAQDELFTNLEDEDLDEALGTSANPVDANVSNIASTSDASAAVGAASTATTGSASTAAVELTPRALMRDALSDSRMKAYGAEDIKRIMNEFELVRVKAPKMVFALQGRLFNDDTRIGSSINKDEILKNPALAYSKSPNSAAPAKPKRHIKLYHNSPLALHFRPVTTIGMVEISTRIDTMPELWQEIEHVLPYLKQP